MDTDVSSKWMEADWARIRRGISLQNASEQVAAKAVYQGGEALVERALGSSWMLPKTLDEIIVAGIQSLSGSLIRLLPAQEVMISVLTALQQRRGFSLLRLGDGELLTLAQQTVLTDAEVRAAGGHFLGYAGVQLPDYGARDQLVQAVQQTDGVGIPTHRGSTFQLLFVQLARVYGWPLETIWLTSSVINYALAETTTFYQQLFQNWRVVLLGNRMAELAQQFRAAGVHSIVASFPVAGVSSIELVMHQLATIDYDVALVSAGVAASILCPRIRATGKVALDFGHMADQLIREKRVF